MMFINQTLTVYTIEIARHITIVNVLFLARHVFLIDRRKYFSSNTSHVATLELPRLFKDLIDKKKGIYRNQPISYIHNYSFFRYDAHEDFFPELQETITSLFSHC